MLDEIYDLRDKMRTLLTKYADMGVETFEKPFTLLEEHNYDQHQVSDVLIFVRNFYAKEYAELHRIFRLPLDNSSNGSELWDRYFSRGLFDLIEMKLLKRQATVCRRAWHLFPKYKKVKKHEDKIISNDTPQNSDGVKVQSEVA